MTQKTESLIEKALQGDKRTIGLLLSCFEDRRAEQIKKQSEYIKALQKHQESHCAILVGLTGSPGVGKSSLIDQMSYHLLQEDRSFRIAVLAVDPSSSISGGSFLGDRNRMRLNQWGDRFFFRSQASGQHLGGMSSQTFPAARLLYYLFDLVFIETVGTGQNEIEIASLADQTLLVLQPMAGDQIQYLKAGIMEIPDAIVLNKCDQKEVFEKSLYSLKASLPLSLGGDISIFPTSNFNGEGISELCKYIRQAVKAAESWKAKELVYLEMWIREELGLQRLNLLNQHSSVEKLILKAGGLEAAQWELLQAP